MKTLQGYCRYFRCTRRKWRRQAAIVLPDVLVRVGFGFVLGVCGMAVIGCLVFLVVILGFNPGPWVVGAIAAFAIFFEPRNKTTDQITVNAALVFVCLWVYICFGMRVGTEAISITAIAAIVQSITRPDSF